MVRVTRIGVPGVTTRIYGLNHPSPPLSVRKVVTTTRPFRTGIPHIFTWRRNQESLTQWQSPSSVSVRRQSKTPPTWRRRYRHRRRLCQSWVPRTYTPHQDDYPNTPLTVSCTKPEFTTVTVTVVRPSKTGVPCTYTTVPNPPLSTPVTVVNVPPPRVRDPFVREVGGHCCRHRHRHCHQLSRSWVPCPFPRHRDEDHCRPNGSHRRRYGSPKVRESSYTKPRETGPRRRGHTTWWTMGLVFYDVYDPTTLGTVIRPELVAVRWCRETHLYTPTVTLRFLHVYVLENHGSRSTSDHPRP